jgi:drug/metabolite transporter (DMT)-like permease
VTAIWIPLVVVAGLFQIARNAAQRGLSDGAGPWGATLVRFAFGVPFTALFLLVAVLVFPPVDPQLSGRFWMAATIGGTAQVLATAALLQAMRASSFGLGSTFQHLSLPITAAVGALLLADHLGALGWTGIAVATLGLLVSSWPRGGAGSAPVAGDGNAVRAGLFGLAAGACFAVSATCYRICGTSLDPGSPFFSSTATLMIVQVMQTAGLGGLLVALDRRALAALAGDLRASLTAGFAGAAASLCWFAALALAPAALVRAMAAVVEAPAATAYGWLRLGERPTWKRSIGSLLIVVGVLVTVLAPR